MVKCLLMLTSSWLLIMVNGVAVYGPNFPCMYPKGVPSDFLHIQVGKRSPGASFSHNLVAALNATLSLKKNR